MQTAVATALAIAAGDLVSPNRWYWAAFAAFVMFQGTRSRGESIAKGAQFVIGTLGGVVFGMLRRPPLLSGHEILTMAAIVAAVFLAFQANVAAYGRMVFWITVILGLLFGMLGFFAPELLLLRLEETAVGCCVRCAGGCLVLVRRERGGGRRTRRGSSCGRWVRRWTVPARALLDGMPPPDLADMHPGRRTALPRPQRDCAVRAARDWRWHATSRCSAACCVLEGCELWAREVGQIGLQGRQAGGSRSGQAGA